jgi:hypothetical protein
VRASRRRIFSLSMALAVICALTGAGPGTGRGPASVEASQEKTLTAVVDAVPNEPFLASNGLTPPSAQYQGPMFSLSHDWPSQPLPPIKDPPWLKAIGGGAISTQNAPAYVAALKDYVSANARQLLLDYAHWDAAKAHWYNEPWLGSTRESIHGTYAAGQFGASIFPGTGLKTNFDTRVLTYYDERAAYTLRKVWGAGAANPDATAGNFQFAEGSVIVKAAVFLPDDPQAQKDWWPATNGAAEWPIYTAIPAQWPASAAVLKSYVMQFDIIVKDSVASPKTGWVFATLVYDRNAKGDAWDKMIPLGAMWGNDPEVDSSAKKAPPLQETWINPAAPKYSTETLGWGGRLAGPNDGARNDIQVGKKAMENHPNSSCMSCHGPAEWQPAQHKQISFLLPSYANAGPGPPYKSCPDGKPTDENICSPAPGSAEWSRWFEDRPGTEAQDADTGSVAADYDMVFTFKTLPMWWKATGAKDAAMPFALRTLRHGTEAPAQFNEYNGAPLKAPPPGAGTPGVRKAMHW